MSLSKYFRRRCDFCGVEPKIFSPSSSIAAKEVRKQGFIRVKDGTTSRWGGGFVTGDACARCKTRAWWYARTLAVTTIRDNGHATSYSRCFGPFADYKQAVAMLAVNSKLTIEDVIIFEARPVREGRTWEMRASIDTQAGTKPFNDPYGNMVDRIIDQRQPAVIAE